MSEEIHEESTIDSCLQLLDGKKDEEKIAGLLMAAKYCKPSNENERYSEKWIKTVIAIYHHVGNEFLDRLINTPIENAYSSSYPSVAFSFLLSLCDIPDLQKEMVVLISSILKALNSIKDDGFRRDVLQLFSSLSSNPQILSFLCHYVSLLYLITNCQHIVNELNEMEKKEKEKEKEKKEKKEKEKEEKEEKKETNETTHSNDKAILLKDSIQFIDFLIQQSQPDSHDLSILQSLLKLTCTCPPSFLHSCLPSCSKLLLSPTLPSSLSQLKSKKKQFLLSIQWVLRRCYTYKQTPQNRVAIFNFVFAVIETLQFSWMNEDIQKSTENIPAGEKSLSITKLLTILLKSASIEIRVNFDFLYKDTIAAYNYIKKDSDPQIRQNTLSTLIDCLYIVMYIMKALADSADIENEFSSFDYDTVIDLSSGWAESLKCAKEFIHLALDITKTDIYKQHYKTNQDFITMNQALEYCSIFINMCLEEFPEEIDDDEMIDDLVKWHETIQFSL